MTYEELVNFLEHKIVLAQRKMEKRRSPLVSIPPFGRGFSRHEGLSSDDFLPPTCNAGEGPPALLSIGSMSPPGYPSAWLRPRSASFRFARQDHCSSARTGVHELRFAWTVYTRHFLTFFIPNGLLNLGRVRQLAM